MPDATSPRATILVFGDLGRSPRMLNHAMAMASDGWGVALVGYCDSPIDAEIAKHPRIRIHSIRTLRRCPDDLPQAVFLAWTLLRLAWAQLQAMWILLAATPRPSVVLVQNPPTVPSLFAGRVGARFRRARLVIDWHNFGFSMLALRIGRESLVVRLLRSYEGAAGRQADDHLCVSSAMAAQLRSEFGIASTKVLYDRPTRLESTEGREERVAAVRTLFPDIDLSAGALTLHCPTSWTDDEDVEMLLDAVALFEQRSSTRLFIVVTGRGPRRKEVEARIAESPLASCKLQTTFLEPADYRLLLRAADCGVSLHRSSSGVDFPMKLVDFFGAGTPALAFDYGACLAERVRHGREVLLFQDAAGLAARMEEISDASRLAALRANVRPAWSETWDQAWGRLARPVMGKPE